MQIALASEVFPTPGTSSISKWPSARTQVRADCTTLPLPCRAFFTLATRLLNIWPKRAMSGPAGCGPIRAAEGPAIGLVALTLSPPSPCSSCSGSAASLVDPRLERRQRSSLRYPPTLPTGWWPTSRGPGSWEQVQERAAGPWEETDGRPRPVRLLKGSRVGRRHSHSRRMPKLRARARHGGRCRRGHGCRRHGHRCRRHRHRGRSGARGRAGGRRCGGRSDNRQSCRRAGRSGCGHRS